jgi:hypothetical protein
MKAARKHAAWARAHFQAALRRSAGHEQSEIDAQIADQLYICLERLDADDDNGEFNLLNANLVEPAG